MPFVKKARDFLDDQGSLTDHKYVKHMKVTVQFLLDNAVGLEKAKSTNTILNYWFFSNFRIFSHI